MNNHTKFLCTYFDPVSLPPRLSNIKPAAKKLARITFSGWVGWRAIPCQAATLVHFYSIRKFEFLCYKKVNFRKLFFPGSICWIYQLWILPFENWSSLLAFSSLSVNLHWQMCTSGNSSTVYNIKANAFHKAALNSVFLPHSPDFWLNCVLCF